MSYTLERWDLSDLFPGLDSDAYAGAGAAIEESLKAFEAERPRLSDDLTPQGLFALLSLYEDLQRQVSRYLGFAYLRFAEDTQDPAAQTMRSRADQVAAEIGNRTLFFTLWWKGCRSPGQRCFQAAGDYRQWLLNLRRGAYTE
jgi:oligoendopeptidase F